MRATSPNRRRPIGEHVWSFSLALLFAIALSEVPWQQLKEGGFIDYERYLRNFGDSIYLTDFAGRGWLEIWRNEALWRLSVVRLAEQFGSVEQALQLIRVIALALMTFYVAIHRNAANFLVLLIAPHFVELVHSQLRSAAAISLLYLALILWQRLHRLKLLGPLIALAAIFTHQFAIVPVLFALASYITTRLNLQAWQRYAILLAPIAVVILLIVIFRDQTLAAIQDRRRFQELSGNTLMLTALLSSVALAHVLRPRHILKDTNAYLAVSASLLAIAFSLVNQPGSARLVAFALPALAVSASRAPLSVQLLILAIGLSAHALYFYFWLE